MEDDSPQGEANDIALGPSRPNPDPTLLTTKLVMREIASVRELLEAKITEVNKIIAIYKEEWHRTLDEMKTASECQAKLVSNHFGFIDERYGEHKSSNEKGLEDVKAYIRINVDGVRDLVDSLKQYHAESMDVVTRRFEILEKDIDRRSADNKTAVDNAFLAAKEAVNEQNRSNNLAISKSEAAFSDQIRQMSVNIQTMNNAVTDKIDDVKDRINVLERTSKATEGHGRGISDMWGWMVGVIGIIATVITLGMLVIKQPTEKIILKPEIGQSLFKSD